MATQFYTIITNVGLAKLTNAQLSGDKVTLTEIAVGDANGSYYTPTENMTALKNEVWRGNINSVEIDKNHDNWIVIESFIPSEDGGFTVREVGAFDEDGDLIAIGLYPETYKPDPNEGASKDLLLGMIIEVSNSDTVNVEIDPNVVIATRNYVNEKVDELGTDITNELNNKVDKVPGKGLSTNDYTTAEKNKLASINEGGSNFYVRDDITLSTLPSEFAVGKTITAVPNGSSLYQNIISLLNSLFGYSLSDIDDIFRYEIQVTKIKNRVKQVVEVFWNYGTQRKNKICEIVRYNSNNSLWLDWTANVLTIKHSGNPNGNLPGMKGMKCLDPSTGFEYVKLTGTTEPTTEGWERITQFTRSGRVVITPIEPNVPTPHEITFDPPLPFIPEVDVTPVTTVPHFISVGAWEITANGFKIWLTRTSTTATSVSWTAKC